VRIIIPKSSRNLCQIGALKGRLEDLQQRAHMAWPGCALTDNHGRRVAALPAMPALNPKARTAVAKCIRRLCERGFVAQNVP
jgi:hypothetical protein